MFYAAPIELTPPNETFSSHSQQVVAYNYLMNYIEIHSYLSSLALSTWPEFLYLIPSLMMKTDQKKKKKVNFIHEQIFPYLQVG